MTKRPFAQLEEREMGANTHRKLSAWSKGSKGSRLSVSYTTYRKRGKRDNIDLHGRHKFL